MDCRVCTPFEEGFCYRNVVVVLVEKGDDEEQRCTRGDERRHAL